MNNVFRLIWNRALGRLVVVSEAARSRDKAATRKGVVGQLPAPEIAFSGVPALLRPAVVAVALAVGSLVLVMPSGQAHEGFGGDDCNGDITRLALGYSSKACADHATAIGVATNASALSATAIGVKAAASGESSLAIGILSTAKGGFSAAVGSGAVSDGDFSSAFGNDAQSAGYASVAFGTSTRSTGHNSTAIGRRAKGLGRDSTAIGVGAQAEAGALRGLSIGNALDTGTIGGTVSNGTVDASGTRVTATDGIAIGSGTRSDAERSTAIGYAAQTSGKDSIAFGTEAEAKGDYGIAQGAQATASGQSAVAVGDTATAGTTRDIAIGNSAETGVIAGATGNQADNVAIGTGAQAFGGTSIAIGEDATATGTSTVAVNSVIAIGRQAKANETAALALGSHASTGMGSSYAAAIGPNAKVGDNANSSIAIGSSSKVANKATFSTAIGSSATVNAWGSVAVGQGATVESGATSATAVGRNAKVLEGAVSGMAIGHDAQVLAKGDVAMGRGASVDGTSDGGPSIGLGADVAINGSANATAIGSNATIGTVASVEDSDGATAIGSAAVVGDKSRNATAIGRNSSIGDSAWDSVALGSAATVGEGAPGAVSIGRSAKNEAGAYDSIALGTSATNLSTIESKANSSIAIGSRAKTSASNAVAMGSDAEAAKNAIALGHDAKATGSQSISIGTKNVVDGDNSGAIGDPSYVSGSGTYTLGNNNGTAAAPISADNAGIFGNNNLMSASATGSRIIGNGNDVDVANAFVIGNGADVTVAEGVALGNGSIADTGAGVAGYNPTTSAADGMDAAIAATESTTGAVAVGDGTNVFRQITGVAAGTADSDAVNVSQLKAVNDVASAGWNVQTNGDTATNVAPNATVQFIDGKNIDITRFGTDITVATADNVDFTNVNVSNNLDVDGDTYLGDNFSVVNNEAFYDGAITENTHIVNKEYVDGGIGDLADTPITFGGDTGTTERKLGDQLDIVTSNANLSTEVTDDETLVIAMSDDLNVNSVTTNTLDVANNATIGGTLNVTGQTTLTGGLDMAGNKITNVGPGTDGTDAVNVDQLTDVSDVANKGWNVQTNGDTATNVAPGDTVQFENGQNIAITRNGTDITVATTDIVDFTEVNVSGDTNIGGNTTIAGDTIVQGDTYLGDNFKVVNNEAFYDGAITENTHIVNKEYVDGGIGDLADTPITFGGDTGTTDRKLGDQLDIVTSNANLSTEVTDDETLVIAMSDDLNVNSVTTNTLDVANNATIGGTLNVTGQTTLTGGLDMAGNKITNVGPGTDGTDAVNVDQLTDVSDVANKGWDLTANGEAVGENIAPGETADFSQGKNIAITRTGNSIEVATADDVDFTNVNVTNQLDVAGDTNIGGNTTIAGDTIVQGDTYLGDSFKVVNNEAFYDGAITENTHIVNKEYVDGGIGDLADTPITFGGDTGTTDRKLGDALNIVTSNANLSTEVTDDETLVIAMSDDLDVNSVTTNTLDVANNATIGGTLNVTGQTTLTGGLDMAGNKITNVGPGTDGTDAVNVDQLTDVSDVANKGWNVQTNGDTTTNVAPGDTVQFENGQNIAITRNGTDITVATTDIVDFTEVNVTENLTVAGETQLGDNFVVNNDGNVTYTGEITEGDHITNKTYVDGLGDDLVAEGLNFAGNDGEVIHKDLGEQLNIVGGMTDLTADAASAENLRTVQNADGDLEVQLSKNLTNLESVESTTVNVTEELTVADNTTINEGGITTNNVDITENLTVAGETQLGDHFVVNNEGNVTYTGDITEGDHITNKTYVDGLGDDLIAEGLNFAGNDGEVIHKDLGEQLDIVGGMTDLDEDAASAENLRTVQNADGALEIQLSKNLTNLESVESTTVNVTEELTVADNTTINEGGITTNNVDITENLTVAGETQLGDNFVVNNDGNVTYTGEITEGDHITNKTYVDGLGDDLVAEGLNFAGNDGEVIHKDLGEQLNIVGGMTDLTADAASAENLRTVQNADGDLEVQLSKNLTNLESVESTTVNVTEELTVADNTTINEGGITTNNVDITENLTVAGETQLGDNFVVNNDGNVTYTGDITEGDHITNKTYVDGLGDDLIAEGLNFAGNDGEVIHKDLGEQLDIVGGMTDLDEDAASAENLRTVQNADGALEIQLSKNLTNLESVESTTVNVTEELTVANNTTINEGGLTTNNVDITENLTVAGETKLGDNFVVNNEGNVTYTGDITEGDHITNKTYVDGLGEDLVAEGLNFAGNDGEVIHKDLGEQLDIVGGMTDLTADAASAENLRTVQNADGALEIQLSKNLTNLESVESTTVNVTEELTVANNTTINEGGLTTNNVDITENLTVAGETQLGDHFVVNNDGNVTYTGEITEGDHITNKTYVDGLGDDLVAEGLNFAGNDGEVIHKDLGEQLNIVGGMTDLTADAASAENLRTVQNADGALEIQLSKNLTNLESVESTTVNVTEELTVADNTTINEGGITTNNVDITENLTVAGETQLGDHFVVNNEGNVTYTGDITEGDHITNKTYVDGLGDDLIAEGLNFAGNDGEVIHKDLGEQLDIVGGMTDLDEDAASAENLRTVRNENGELEIQLSKNLTNLESVESTTVNVTEELTVANNTTINEGGLTTNNVDITENLTVAGETKLGDNFVVNNEGNVTYTGDITEGDHITNKTYVDGLGDDLIAEGLNFAGNDGEVIHKDLGEQLDIVGGMTDLDEDAASAENLRTVQNADGDLEVQLSKNLTNLESVESTTVNVTEELTVADNTTINEGGITTNNVDITENLTVAGETKLGDNFVVNNEGNVTYTGEITEGDHITNKTYVDGLGDDLVAEGLNFAGNDGEVIHKDLGEQLNIVGGMTDLTADAASAENLRTVQNADGDLEVQLSKNLTNLESVESTTVNVTEELTVADNTTINEGGITTNNVDITENLTVAGETKLGDNFVVNNEGNVTYTGEITEGDHITNKTYVDGLGDDLVAEGLNFAGNDGEVIHKDLGEQLNIVGGMTDLTADAASAENLRTVQNADGDLEVQLSKNLTNLESVESTTVNVTEELTVADNTTINEGGITTNNMTVNENLTVEGDTHLNENLYVDGSTTINENLTVEGDTHLGDHFSIVNNEAYYDGPITEGDHITNKTYVDNSVTELGDTPLTFGANEGEDTERRLGDRLDIVGEADDEGHSNIITKVTDEETLELALNADLNVDNSITVGDTFIDGDSITTNNMTVNENLTVEGDTHLNENLYVDGSTTINENLTVEGDTHLGDHFSIVNNEAHYDGSITEGDHITNKTYVDNSVTELGDTPLTFGANEGEDTERRLGDRLDIVGEADDEGHSNIITKVTDEETLELALNADLNVDNSITVGETFIDGDSITTNNMTVNENLTVAGETRLGDNFFVNNEGNVTYTGDITEGDHITNKSYVDNSVTELGDTPLTFAGDSGESFERRLGETANVKGGAEGGLTEGNIGVVADGEDTLNIQLAENIDLGEDGSLTINETLIDGDQVITNNMTVNENLTVEGDTFLNENLTVAGNTTINENLTVEGDTYLGDSFSVVNNEAHYDGPITDETHITNKQYVDNSVSEVADTPLTFGANEGEDTERRLGDRLDIVGEADDEGHSNIITKVTDEETLELALNADLNVDNSITVGETFIDGDSITTNNMTVNENLTVEGDTFLNENLYVDGSTTINENLTVEGDTHLGDHFSIVNNEAYYDGPITEGDHITNKSYVDNSVTELGDTPLTFGANEGEDTERRLGDRLDIVGEADDEGHSNIITKVTDDETLELALNADLNVDNSITVGETFIDGDSVTTNNMTVNENLTVAGETRLGDNFFVNNEGNVTYTGDITEGDHITNKNYVDNSVTELGDTPLTFAGDSGESFERRLGETANVKGGAEGGLTEGNIGVVADGEDTLNIQLAENIDLGEDGSLTINETLIDGDQVITNNMTVNENLTVEGDTFLNENLTVAGNTTINENLTVEGDTYLGDSFSVVNNEAHYDGPITDETHITNKQYVDNSVSEVADTPLTFGANEGEDTERRLGDRLDIVGEADDEGHSNIITKLSDDETLKLALNADLNVDNSITVGETFIDGDSITTNNMTVNENLTVVGETRLGDNFFVNNEGNVTYTGEITEGDHITNKSYVDNSVGEVADTPLTFGANEGEDTERRLGDRLDIVGEADEEGNSNIITKLSDDETLELALNDDLKIVSSITVGEDGPTISGDGIDMGDNKITNVADGDVSADSKDAINGSQLYQLESIVTNVTGDISNEYVTENGLGIRYVRTNDSGLAVSDAFAQGEGSTAVGYEAIASADRALALGYDAIASHQGSVALGEGARTAEAVSTASVEIAGQTYQFAGVSPVATVSVGSVGAERTVTNVAAGRISAESTDAINGSQLYATNQAVGELDNRVTTVEGDISNITNDLADLDDRAVKYDRNDDGSVDYNTITLEGDGGTKITNVAPGDIAQNSSDAVNGSQLWDVQNQITNIEQGGSKYFRANSDGPAADPQGADSIAMGSDSVAAGDRSVASGAGAQAKAEGSVALGADSVADREGMNGERERFSNESVASTQGAVSVGSEGNERQITNVAGGTRDTDAVNVRQLDAVQRGAVNYDRDEDGNVDYSTITLKGAEGTTITNVAPGVNETDAVNVGQMNELGRRFENEIVNVHGRIDSVERNANAGSASAIAASTVPQAWMPGKSMIGVGAGTYGGESAVSVGVSRLSDNGRWVIQGKVTGDSQSNFGAGIGAGWHW
ncbi:YadA-like family protein [Halomonas sp. KG2]|uniref:YadA-like family protein n=1 Tax=Halomonas sp. KG2 TaxID=2951138 RepID=UPI0026495422|nr:YadA-like family protein [Halomonas sp. KG2]WKD27605.1 YadA-like family protein [Halomonas sp. KG2]